MLMYKVLLSTNNTLCSREIQLMTLHHQKTTHSKKFHPICARPISVLTTVSEV